jgi:beta-lactam-binding protein with PASTA domain
VVPKVVGKPLAKAKATIANAHCKTGAVTRVKSKLKAGLVVSESPKPGMHLKNGAKVNLKVSRGKK